MTASEQIALEEIYRLNLHGTGKRERNTRRICEAVLGTRASVVKADWIASKPQPDQS